MSFVMSIQKSFQISALVGFMLFGVLETPTAVYGQKRKAGAPRAHVTALTRAEIKQAEARLAEKLDDEEAAMVSAALAHSLAQLKVKRRQHR